MLQTKDSKLNDLLVRNQIMFEDFVEEAYNCLMVSIFEIIANELNDQEYKRYTKHRLINGSNKVLTTQKIVYELTRCRLNVDECQIIYRYIYAYLTKKNQRNVYADTIKQKLLIRQNHKCNICKTNIKSINSELDHIVPWTYVGDELGIENLQMLCIECNRKKSKNSAYNLKMFLINK